MFIFRPASAAGSGGVGLRTRQPPPVLSLPGRSPLEIRLISLPFIGLRPLQLLPAAVQSLPARARVHELGRQLVAARLSEELILGRVRIRRLREHALDLLPDRGVAARRAGEALPASKLPSSATTPTDTSPALAQSANTCVKVPANACA